MKKKNILFTSINNDTNFYNLWLDESRNYDICLCYYGSQKNKEFEKYADYYFENKGSKFQNFYYIWNTYPFIKNYDNYFIVDDDIIINTSEINKLFDIMNKYNLWILQPSFKKISKISHQITKQKINNFIRYVNFIEVNTMMIKKEQLQICMEIYDPILVGYGIDWLFIWKLGQYHKNKYAIIDTISCVNPKRKSSIDILQNLNVRFKIWSTFKNSKKILEWEHTVWSSIKSEL